MPIWSILTTLSIKALRIIQFVAGRVSAFTYWLAEKIHISSKLAATGTTVGVSTGGGFVMIGVNEYLAAMVCWVIAAVVCLSKSIHWKGFENYPRLTVAGRIIWIIGTFVFIAFMYHWTEIMRGDELWSNLQAKKEPTTNLKTAVTANPNPKPAMTVESISLATKTFDASEPYRVLLVLAISNNGPPSTLRDFHVRVILKSGRQLKTENIAIPSPISLRGQMIYQHQSIFEKTGTTPIPTGGRVVGVHYFRLVDLLQHGNFHDAKIELNFKDAFGNEYKGEFRADELEDRTPYIPGL